MPEPLPIDPTTQFIGDCDVDAFFCTRCCVDNANQVLSKAFMSDIVTRKVINPILKPVIHGADYCYMFAVETKNGQIIWFSINKKGFAHNYRVVIGQFLAQSSGESSIWVERYGSTLDEALKAPVTYDPNNYRQPSKPACKCGASSPCGVSKKGTTESV